MTKEQQEKISLISHLFDEWVESFGDNYMNISEHLGHSVSDIQEKLNDLYYFNNSV